MTVKVSQKSKFSAENVNECIQQISRYAFSKIIKSSENQTLESMQNIRRQTDYQKPSNTGQMWCGDINKKHK